MKYTSIGIIGTHFLLIIHVFFWWEVSFQLQSNYNLIICLRILYQFKIMVYLLYSRFTFILITRERNNIRTFRFNDYLIH